MLVARSSKCMNKSEYEYILYLLSGCGDVVCRSGCGNTRIKTSNEYTKGMR